MLPAETLPVQKGDVILDLCAAPGGKSTQLCLTREALLVSNDISRSRTIPLVKNLERFGTGNFIVTCESPDKLASVWAETFDCILVDAPCSGEGMFRKDQNLIDAYEKNGPEHYAPIQSQILENAYKMLKGGGKLLYSTCTFSDIEDEQVIISFLSGHPDLSVVDIEKKFGLCGPYMRYSDNPEISGIVHALPHMFKGEGHFMALIRKDGCGFSRCSGNADTQTYSDIVNIFGDMADHFSDGFTETLSKKRFYTSKDGFIYMLPDGFDEMFDKSIRYSRTGICMGYMSKGGKFIPHTAFALAMKYEDYENRLCLDADDPLVIKYLKGETLLIGEGEQNILEKGTVLICAGAYPLGFAAYDGIKLKNLFEKGWIYR